MPVCGKGLQRLHLQWLSALAMLYRMLMLCILIAFAVLPAVAVTALLAFVIRRGRSTLRAPAISAFLVGTVVPFIMITYGLYLSWPWPWSQPETMYDSLGQKGSWLVLTSAPAWLGCLIVSRLIIRSWSKQSR